MSSIGKPYARALALTLLAVLIILLLTNVVGPWITAGLAHTATMARLADELEAKQALAARVPALEARLETLAADPKAGQRLLTGANESVAGTALQSTVRGILTSAKAEIVSVEGLPPEADKPLSRIAARVIFRGDETVLRDVLHGTAGATPFVYVERVMVNAVGPVTNAASAAKHLNVTLELFGYWRGGA